MKTLLHIDASARSGSSSDSRFGSHSRRLTSRFVRRWKSLQPQGTVVYRDVGQLPPQPVTGEWIHAAFTRPEEREPWMQAVLAESDQLIDELLGADVIVAGVPMYNFGMPAPFKAYIDNIVRVERTFGFDRTRKGEPYWPLVTDGKTLVILSARGDYGYDPGERLERMNHVEGGVSVPFGYIGITDVHSVAVEYDEFADERLQHSIRAAEERVDALVWKLVQGSAQDKVA